MRRQSGFILPLTLWILAAVAIAAGVFAERMMGALELARLSQQRVQNLIDMADTRAEILFRLASTPMSLYGLGADPAQAVALDDRPYRGEGSTLVRLQDDRGLFNLNLSRAENIHRFLGALNIPYEQRSYLVDTLNDYVDADDFKHLNGAEAREYEAAGLPPPRNAPLVTPYEARNVYGWGDSAPLWKNGLLTELTVTGLSVGLNPNTAPWQVLMALPGMTEEIAKNIIESRQRNPIRSVEQVAPWMESSSMVLLTEVFTLPSDSVRVTQTVPGQAWAMRYNVALTPNAANAPWRIDYSYKIESPYGHDERAGQAPRLPEKSALPENPATPFLP